MATMERVTGIGGVFQRAGQAASLRDWYAEHLGIDLSDWGIKPFERTPGGSTTWAIFDHDTEYFGRAEQAFMVNFRVADLDAMLAQLRSAGVEVIDALEESEYGRFGWAVDAEGTRFELWEPPAGPLTAGLAPLRHLMARRPLLRPRVAGAGRSSAVGLPETLVLDGHPL
jgi:predicted enzyme related to lactoylglutathione lyase